MCLACADKVEERGERSVAATEIGAPDLPAFELPVLSVAAFRAHASALAHDSMAGRAPGTPGGEMAASYLVGAFRQAGLAVPDGSPGYRQEVPFRRARVRTESVVANIRTETQSISLDTEELIVKSGAGGPRAEFEGRLVFVGHGVASPEMGWDDYAGHDVAGAFVVILPGAPEELMLGLTDGGASTRAPPAPGAYALTMQGKAAAARRLGARGMIELTSPGEADGFASRRRMSSVVFPTPAWGDSRVPDFHVTLGADATAELLAAAGTDWDRAVAAGARGDAGFDSRIDLRLEFDQDVSEFTAPNIVGVINGATDEIVVMTAHYDGYGIGPATAEGDSVYNGSMDNADGTAGLIEFARAFARRPEPPRRTIVFVATTAEEAGMLGARYYLDNPVGSLEATAVNINIDGLGFRQPTNDFNLFPVDGTDAVPTLERLAEPLGMSFRAEPWHGGMHFSFDTVEFLRRGIVGMTLWQGSDVREEFRGMGGGGGPTHSPMDEYSPDSGDAGIEQHLALYRAILEHYADGGEAPRLTTGHPFENIGRTIDPAR